GKRLSVFAALEANPTDSVQERAVIRQGETACQIPCAVQTRLVFPVGHEQHREVVRSELLDPRVCLVQGLVAGNGIVNPSLLLIDTRSIRHQLRLRRRQPERYPVLAQSALGIVRRESEPGEILMSLPALRVLRAGARKCLTRMSEVLPGEIQLSQKVEQVYVLRQPLDSGLHSIDRAGIFSA